ncbi:type I methionyl aminopeptidase [Candidatus Gracilibacteria bacterium]|nr:MAG: type I methionyl aminopeptidase [Candidatus Gracilibacteria bacterium]
MLTKQEINILKQNAKIHKEIFDEIKKILKDGTTAVEINKLCGDIAKKHNVLCGFKGVYGFPDNICISVNDVVVHGRCLPDIVFKDGDLVTFDFGIKDKKFGINTDAAFSVVIGGDEKNPKAARMIEANKKALYAGIKMAKAGNTTGDIGAAIQKVVEQEYGYKIVKELTGHAVGKKLHEKPYIYNYGKPGSGQRLKAGMVLAIEPILGETSGEIVDNGDWEIYIKDGSLGCQYEHTILITESEAEIII